MSNSKISALTSATTPLAGTETLPVVQSSTTKQVSVANLTAGRNVSVLQLGAGVASPATVLDTAGSTGSALNFKMAPNGWNIRHRVGVQYTGDGAVWSNNALMSSATAGDLDDVSNSGSALLLNTSGNLSYVTATAGANPRTFTNRWTANGSGDFTLSTGNFIPSTAAKGVNFTANTPLAGKTSQLLNWYEEGTWTPTATSQAGAITAYASGGTYTRVGRQVTVTAYVDLTNVGTATGYLQISNFPFKNGGASGAGYLQQTGTVRETGVTGLIYVVLLAGNSTNGYINSLTNGPIVWANTYQYALTITYYTA